MWSLQATRTSARPCFKSPLIFLLWHQIPWQNLHGHKEVSLLQCECRCQRRNAKQPRLLPLAAHITMLPSCPLWATQRPGKHDWLGLLLTVEGARHRTGPHVQLRSRTERQTRLWSVSGKPQVSISPRRKRKLLCRRGGTMLFQEMSLPQRMDSMGTRQIT